ncbi:MAG: S8 family serine peptidase, partial [Chloroflexi bacterium]|nr:S8 family serine peptidase [Chloroflexota bacterium]
VAVMLEMEDEAAAEHALTLLPDMGGEKIGHYSRWIDAWIPIANLDQVGQVPGVIYARQSVLVEPLPQPEPPEDTISTQAGNRLSAGVDKSGADVWHGVGYTGEGVRVAVIDNGAYGKLQAAIDAGDLPTDVILHPSVIHTEGGNPHGTAVAEIIHDMAPNAELILASYPIIETALAELVEDLAADWDVDVINGSFSLQQHGPGDGSGPFAEAVSNVGAVHDTVVVMAGGNEARGHWVGTFRDDNGDGWHEFADQDASNIIHFQRVGFDSFAVPQGTELDVFLRWNDWPVSDQDFDLYLYAVDPETGDLSAEPVAEDSFTQDGTLSPYARFSYTVQEESKFAIGVFARNIDTSRSHVLNLTLIASDGDVVFANQVPERSLSNLASANAALVAAAVDVESFDLEPYSAQGPTFGPGGSLNGGHDKPDLAGYANVRTTAFPLFNGTSAAAPHIAGAVALLQQRHPEKKAIEIRALINSLARDIEPTGYDHQTGHGILFLASPCDNDPNEPDNEPFQGTRITVGNSLQQVNCTDGDEDWFMFEVSEFVRLEITVEAENGDPQIVLYNQNRLNDPLADDFGTNRVATIDHTFERSGTYLLRVKNFDDLDVIERPYTLSLTQQAVIADMPFRETFSSATVREYFEPRSTQDGRIYVADPNFDAGMHLILDSGRNGARNVLNEAILHVDTTGFDNIRLSFDHREYNDEDTVLPPVFTGSVNGDGVSFSVDGETWYRVANLTGDNSKNFFNHISIDLSHQAEQHDVMLGDDVRIKFQQFETGAYGVPTDGHAYDNIEVTGVELGMPPSLDFDGDGVADILCHNDDNGANAVWMMNGLSVADKEALSSVPDSNTSIVGAGDFDNNGITDVLWYNSETDGLYAWMMDGGIAPAQINRLPKFSGEYRFSVGNFNGDEYDDILYYKPRTGSSGLLLMEDGEVMTFDFYYSSSSSLIGVGDYNGDGKTDTFWQNRSRGYSGIVLSGGTRGNVTGDFESTEHV